MSTNQAWRQTKGAQTLNYVAGEALEDGLIAKYGATENEVLKATDALAAYAGVVCQPKDIAQGDCIDVQNSGTAIVQAGGAINYGDTVISDGDGKAIAGVAGYILGVAQQTVGAPAVGEKALVSIKLDLHNV